MHRFINKCRKYRNKKGRFRSGNLFTFSTILVHAHHLKIPEEIKIQVLKYYSIFLGEVNKHIDTELNPLKRKKNHDSSEYP